MGVVYMKEKGLSLLLQLFDDMVGLLDPELKPTSSEAEVVCCACVCMCVVCACVLCVCAVCVVLCV